ncbi:MAG: suppressor of fused domain protein [Coriobacteriales bacterium]|nr:suppressor of fused domain protein [Coriobacteriales bacterium]
MGLFDRFKKKAAAAGIGVGPAYVYSDQELEEFDAYVERAFGPYDSVLHEIASPDIHLDVVIVPPSPGRDHLMLLTMGAGAYRMDVPSQFAKYELEYAEYAICLPADWNLESGDDRDYWPVRLLKDAGRLPVSCDTWLGYGHTMQNDEDGSPYAPGVGFNSAMLAALPQADGKVAELRMSNGKLINFYLLLPLYPEELAFKFEHGADDLIDLLAETDGFPVLDVARRNCCAGE